MVVQKYIFFEAYTLQLNKNFLTLHPIKKKCHADIISQRQNHVQSNRHDTDNHSPLPIRSRTTGNGNGIDGHRRIGETAGLQPEVSSREQATIP
jgi:hypothetical protein